MALAPFTGLTETKTGNRRRTSADELRQTVAMQSTEPIAFQIRDKLLHLEAAMIRTRSGAGI